MGIKQEEFDAIIKQLVDMSNDQIAALSFQTWQEAYNRAAVETEREMQELVDNVVGKR